jgi:hypothetical protein
VKVLGRGHTEFTEVPDQPTVPTLTGAPIARGPEAPAGTQVAQVTPDHGTARADSTSAPAILTFDATPSMPTTLSFAHANTPMLLAAVASAVTDIQLPAMSRGDAGASSDTSGGGELARGAETLVSLSLDGPAYADHGWFIVPSASNEYGEGYAAADEFAFDIAAGEFASDWFWV